MNSDRSQPTSGETYGVTVDAIEARDAAVKLALDRYWRISLRTMAVLLGVWAFVSLGCGVQFADWLNRFILPGTAFPLGFWFAQQGAIATFVLCILAYCIAMNPARPPSPRRTRGARGQHPRPRRRRGRATSRSGSRTAATTPGRRTCGRARTVLAESLATIYERIVPDQRLILEYKFFEPVFYHTDVCDWGTAYAQCAALGERALVCLDAGHHAPGTNIEFIVMQLLRLGKLGAFDFNSRFYADDDLIVGAADPFQLFRILVEVIRGGGYAPDAGVSFMLDQCHNVEDKIPGQIRSVLNVQEMTARALLLDRDALADAQEANDVLAAHGLLMDAFYTDVRRDLADWRQERGLPSDPLAAYAASGHAETIAGTRKGGRQAGSGA